MAVVPRFIDRINAGDIDGFCALMTEDPLFIDGLGNTVSGRDKLRAGWKTYLEWFPDYRISHKDIFEDHGTVAVFWFSKRHLCGQWPPAKGKPLGRSGGVEGNRTR